MSSQFQRGKVLSAVPWRGVPSGYTEVAPGLLAPSIIPGDPADLDPKGEVALYQEGNITLAPLDIDQTDRVWVRKRLGFAVRGLRP